MGGAKNVIIYSLTEGMPFTVKIGFLLKMGRNDLAFMQDPCVIKWTKFLETGKYVQMELSIFKASDTVCCLAHTGGTTGEPKEVLLTDYAMNAVVHQYKLCMEHKRKQIFLNMIVPFVVYGFLICMHMPLSLGLCTVIIPKFEAKDLQYYLKKYRPNHMAGIPSYFNSILKEELKALKDFSCIQTLAVGGDGMNAILEKELNLFLKVHGSKAKVIKGYGMTEVCATAVTGYKNANKEGSVGIPLVKNNIQVFDNDSQKECQFGEIGEIYISSPSIMMGYKDNIKDTQDIIQIRPDGSRWMRTGDLGYMDEDGFLFLIGRMKRMIFLGPEGMVYKVYPKMIEELLELEEGVRNACIISVPKQNILVSKAFIVLAEDYKGREDEIEKSLRILCRNNLHDYMNPQYYEFLNALPLTSVGKVDYKALE